MTSPFFGDGGLGCITQVFECGEPGTGSCTVQLMVRLDLFDAGPNSGVVRVFANGEEAYASDPVPFELGWTEVMFAVPCGTVELDLCLDAFPGNQAWIAGFDMVTAVCDETVRNDSGTWSAIKALF